MSESLDAAKAAVAELNDWAKKDFDLDMTVAATEFMFSGEKYKIYPKLSKFDIASLFSDEKTWHRPGILFKHEGMHLNFDDDLDLQRKRFESSQKIAKFLERVWEDKGITDGPERLAMLAKTFLKSRFTPDEFFCLFGIKDGKIQFTAVEPRWERVVNMDF